MKDLASRRSVRASACALIVLSPACSKPSAGGEDAGPPSPVPSAIDSSAAGEGGTDAAADAVKRFNFNCIEGALALGLGFGGYYAQSVAWEPAAKGKSDEAAAHAICSRMKATWASSCSTIGPSQPGSPCEGKARWLAG